MASITTTIALDESCLPDSEAADILEFLDYTNPSHYVKKKIFFSDFRFIRRVRHDSQLSSS